MVEHVSVSNTTDFHLQLHRKEISAGYEHEKGEPAGEHWHMLKSELDQPLCVRAGYHV